MTARWSAILDTDSGLVGWADGELYRAWCERIASLMASGAALESLRGAEGIARRRAALRDLVFAVSCAYRACNVSPPSDAEYVRLYLEAWTPDGLERVTPPEPSGPSLWGPRVDPFCYQPSIERLFTRCGLGWNGVPSFASIDTDAAAFASQHTDGQVIPLEGGEVLAVTQECFQRTVPLGPCDLWRSRILTPSLWEWELWRAIGARLLARSPWEVALDARDYSVRRNLEVVKLYNLGGAGDAAALVGAAAINAANAQQVGSRRSRESMRAAQATASIIVAAGGPVGVVIGGIFLAALEGLQALGDAVGWATGEMLDVWGRVQPAVTLWRISGGAGEAERPTHDVPEPPGFVRAPRGGLRVTLPSDVPSARVRVDGGEPRPAIWDGEVIVGAHLVEVAAEGKVPTARTLTVGPGARTEWSVSLVDLAAGEYAAPPLTKEQELAAEVEAAKERELAEVEALRKVIASDRKWVRRVGSALELARRTGAAVVLPGDGDRIPQTTATPDGRVQSADGRVWSVDGSSSSSGGDGSSSGSSSKGDGSSSGSSSGSDGSSSGSSSGSDGSSSGSSSGSDGSSSGSSAPRTIAEARELARRTGAAVVVQEFIGSRSNPGYQTVRVWPDGRTEVLEVQRGDNGGRGEEVTAAPPGLLVVGAEAGVPSGVSVTVARHLAPADPAVSRASDVEVIARGAPPLRVWTTGAVSVSWVGPGDFGGEVFATVGPSQTAEVTIRAPRTLGLSRRAWRRVGIGAAVAALTTAAAALSRSRRD